MLCDAMRCPDTITAIVISQRFNTQSSDDDNGKKKKSNKRSRKNIKSISDNNDLTEEEKQVVVSSLHRVLKPFLLRRIKSDVIKDLPLKVILEIHLYFHSYYTSQLRGFMFCSNVDGVRRLSTW